MNFKQGSLDDGWRYRLFNVLDEFNCEGMRIEVDLSLPSAKGIQPPDQITECRGRPNALR